MIKCIWNRFKSLFGKRECCNKPVCEEMGCKLSSTDVSHVPPNPIPSVNKPVIPKTLGDLIKQEGDLAKQETLNQISKPKSEKKPRQKKVSPEAWPFPTSKPVEGSQQVKKTKRKPKVKAK